MPTVQNPNLRGGNPTTHFMGAILFGALLVLLLVSGARYLTHTAFGARLFALAAQESAALKEAAIVSRGTSANFGWLGFIAKPVYLALQFIYRHGIHNWGWSIVALTLAFNLLLLWPRIFSMRSSLNTAQLQPKVEAVRKRYAHLRFDDPKHAAMNTEIMSIYRAEGRSMYGGCFPILLQAPLFLAYLRVLEAAGELRNASWLWIHDLAGPDPLHLLPILIIFCMASAQYIAPSPGISTAQRQLLALAAPLVMGFTLWHCASGLALYWLTGSLFSLVLQLCFNAAVRFRSRVPSSAA